GQPSRAVVASCERGGDAAPLLPALVLAELRRSLEPGDAHLEADYPLEHPLAVAVRERVPTFPVRSLVFGDQAMKAGEGRLAVDRLGLAVRVHSEVVPGRYALALLVVLGGDVRVGPGEDHERLVMLERPPMRVGLREVAAERYLVTGLSHCDRQVCG